MKLTVHNDDPDFVFEYDTENTIFCTDNISTLLQVDKILGTAHSYIRAIIDYETFDQPWSGDEDE